MFERLTDAAKRAVFFASVEANHRKLGAQTQDVEVKDSDATANFTFEVK